MIRVNEDYVVDVDKLCYAAKIDKHKKDKKDNDIYEVVGYYGTLEEALKGIVKFMNRCKLSEGVHTLKEAIQIITESNEYLARLLEEKVTE